MVIGGFVSTQRPENVIPDPPARNPEGIDHIYHFGNITVHLKLVSAIFYQIFIFSPNDSPSKTMKSVFYFI